MKKPLLLHSTYMLVTVVASLLGLASPCYGVERVGDTVGDVKKVAEQLSSGWVSINARDLESAKKIADELDSSILPQGGKVLLGSVYYREKQYQKAIDVIQPIYPIPTSNITDANTKKLIVSLNMLAASTIGKAKYELKYPDAETLTYLLEGTRLRLSDGVLDDEALDKIYSIYLKEGKFGLALGFGLERYNKYKKLYDSKTPLGDKKVEDYLHGNEYMFAEIFAGMGHIDGSAKKTYLDESAKWLKKALAFEKGNYRDMASKDPLLKPVLELLTLKTNR